jgi:hypothetical protein
MRRITLVLAVLCALLWATGASASVTVTYGPLAAGGGVQLKYYSSNVFVEDVYTNQGGMMAFVTNPNGTRAGIDAPNSITNPTGLDNQIKSPVFCVEIPENMSTGGTYTYGSFTQAGIVPLASAPKDNAGHSPHPMGTNAADLIMELWGQYFSTLNSTTKYGAFQAAIWKLEYDNGSNNWATGNLRTTAVTAGGVPTGTGELNMAYNMIADILTNEYAPAKLVALSAGVSAQYPQGLQDFVGVGVAHESTPEPASLIVWTVLASGAAGMAMRRRRSGARWSAENRQAIMGMIDSKLQD